MAINLHQINEHEKKKAAQQAEVKPDMTQPMAQPSSGLAQGVDKSPINNPALDESLKQSVADNVMGQMLDEYNTKLATAPQVKVRTPEEIKTDNRNAYVRGFNTWADAEKAGDVSQQEWITQKINQMVERGENPGEYETLMSLMGSAETPNEIKKRERRNALGETFRNLGNLIGNAANLYYTNKGGQYIDLNTANEKHRERMQTIKDKQDALAEKRNNILINAKLGDLKAARAEKVAKDKAAKDAAEKQADRAWKAKYDAYMKELDNAYKLGQIDAQTKARLETLAVQAENAEKLEEIRQGNKIEVANINNTAAKDRAEIRSGGSGSKKATLTYNGKSYKKNDLAAMKSLYDELVKDGYDILPVKDTDEKRVTKDDYTKAILGAKKRDAKNPLGKKADIIDSDIHDASNGGVIKYVPDEEEELEEWE